MMHLRADPRNRRPAGKYSLAVLAIFRNESHVLEEWLRHYIAFGVEHLYLIDNNSSDDFLAVLAPHIDAGRISLFHCEKDGYQIGAYTELLPTIQQECEWIGVFD